VYSSIIKQNRQSFSEFLENCALFFSKL